MIRWAVLAVLAGPVAAEPVVVDVRSEAACLEASLPGARCVPAAWLLEGGPLPFHALRWLLGTVGLSGDETVAVYGEGDAALAAAGLIHLAGQARVVVAGGGEDGPGTPRGFSREAVFTAPVRLTALEVLDADDPLAALVAYGGAQVEMAE